MNPVAHPEMRENVETAVRDYPSIVFVTRAPGRAPLPWLFAEQQIKDPRILRRKEPNSVD